MKLVWSKKNKDPLTNANTTNPVGGVLEAINA